MPAGAQTQSSPTPSPVHRIKSARHRLYEPTARLTCRAGRQKRIDPLPPPRGPAVTQTRDTSVHLYFPFCPQDQGAGEETQLFRCTYHPGDSDELPENRPSVFLLITDT